MTVTAEHADLYLPPADEGERPAGPPRGRLSGLDLRNTWQIAAGAVLLPLGIALILLAWSGAAHGRVDQQQIPYLVSGGLGGLAVVIIGCFFFWAHWLYRIYDQADLHHREAMRAGQEDRELMRSLLEALSAGGPRPGGAGGRAGSGRNGNGRPGSSFVATPTGTNFHVPGCPLVANRRDSLRPVSDDEAGRMKPCRVCEPLVTG